MANTTTRPVVGPHSHRWTELDRAVPVDAASGYLKNLSLQDAVRRYKRETYELLRLGPGAHALDVGCGTGDDVRAIAAITGGTGRAVGIDTSEALVSQARLHSASNPLGAEFYVMDGSALDFADQSFDSVRTDRVLQHLPNPWQVLSEMIRVTKPGGAVLAIEPDWETLLIDSVEERLTRRIMNFNCARLNQGWCGRQLRRKFIEAGLTDIIVRAANLIVTDFALANRIYEFENTLDVMVAERQLARGEAHRWLHAIKEADRQGHFFNAITAFMVCGIKPLS